MLRSMACSPPKKPLIAVIGATGTGKSQVSSSTFISYSFQF